MNAYTTEEFVGSIRVNTHWTFPKYIADRDALIALLVNSGIRHIRDGADTSNAFQRDILVELYAQGITSNMIILPQFGVVPNLSYWSGREPENTITVNQYLKDYMPTGVVESVEMLNEIDLTYSSLYWHNISEPLSGDPDSPLFYADYAIALTQDIWTAMRLDPTLDNVAVIGPSLGVVVPSPFPDGSLYSYVNYGNFHPYPARENAFNPEEEYGSILYYYHNSFQPSSNVSTDPPYNTSPIMKTWYQPPFQVGDSIKQMAATETGYTNGTSTTAKSFSELLLAKQGPRIFAEYFRNGIAPTYFYELVDEGDDPTNPEENDGLIRYNLTPKPVLTALTSLIRLLEEPGADFTPSSLNYSLSVQPVGAYTRTEYVHDLLLQKSNGVFYLLLWHEISNSSNTTVLGAPIVGQQRDIAAPSLLTTITLPSTIRSASVLTYNADWEFESESLTITDRQIVVKAMDVISVVRLERSHGAEAFLLLQTSGKIELNGIDGFVLLEGSNNSGSGMTTGNVSDTVRLDGSAS